MASASGDPIPAGPAESGPAEAARLRDVYVLILVVDGVPGDVFEKLLHQGRLPNIDQYLVRRGCTVRKALSLFPTVTFSTQVGCVTGLYPGHYSVPGIRWFDRFQRRERNYLGVEFWKLEDDLALYSPCLTRWDGLMKRPETLFARAQGVPTLAVQQIVSREATQYRFFPLRLTLGKLCEYMPHRTDEAITEFLYHTYAESAEKPRFTFGCLPDFDSIAHLQQPDSRASHQALEGLDRRIGRIVRGMQEGGIFEKSYIILTSDHGNTNLRRGDVAGYRTVLERLGLEPRHPDGGPYRSLVACNSLNSAAVYVADPQAGWQDRPDYTELRNYTRGPGQPPVDLLQALTGTEGTDFLIVREPPDCVRIVSPSSELLITCRIFLAHRYYRVELVRGTEPPWGYGRCPGLARMIRSGRFHHGDEWLAASLGTDYPDAVVQACQILDNFRTGDVFVSLAPGWKAKSSRYRATHGSLFVTDMHVPMIISGPDIRSGEIPSARLVDIYPTALRLLGLDVPFGTIDGRPLDELLPESLTHQTDSRKAEIEALAPAMCRLWELETDAGDGSPLRAEQARRELLRSIANQWDLLGQVLEQAHRRASHYLKGHEFHGLEGRLSRSLVRDREKDIARILSLLEQLEVSAASCCPSDHASIR